MVGSTLYFVAQTGVSDVELWKTDGTGAGTVLVKDLWPGPSGSYPAELVVMGSTLFFTSSDPTHGRQLWRSDGTAGGTVIVKTLQS